ncbi:MAG TPA: chlorite dismutase family protein [Anaerolineae bacterium]|nr:chlorite dismutase family protein [Anaerolineae bacterium]
MSEQTLRSLNHFALYSFTESYWRLSAEERSQFHQKWLAGLRDAAQNVHVYQVFPAEARSDILVWSAMTIEDQCETSRRFAAYARATNPYRSFIRPTEILWGYSQPSEYTKTRSTRELDPLAEPRPAYLVVYPFVKTTGWYLMSREARHGMMNEHIRIGKQYTEIGQLLLYSFGVQDQEFVVVYEMEDLTLFSQLVHELRSTEGRRFTERDTPLHTAIYHPAEETLALF